MKRHLHLVGREKERRVRERGGEGWGRKGERGVGVRERGGEGWGRKGERGEGVRKEGEE